MYELKFNEPSTDLKYCHSFLILSFDAFIYKMRAPRFGAGYFKPIFIKNNVVENFLSTKKNRYSRS